VAAVSPSDAWAVGRYLSNSNPGPSRYRPLVLHWDGSTWSTIPTPLLPFNALISALSADGPNDVWMVGSEMVQPDERQITLTEHWNGSAWSVVTSPDAGDASDPEDDNALTGVDAIAPDDAWAVGQYLDVSTTGLLWDTVAEHWDGSTWSIVPSPTPALDGGNVTMSAVAAISANDVYAVGSDDYTGSNGSTADAVMMHWNGSAWSLVPVPEPGSPDFTTLGGVTASPGAVMTVGGFYDPSAGGPRNLVETGCV